MGEAPVGEGSSSGWAVRRLPEVPPGRSRAMVVVSCGPENPAGTTTGRKVHRCRLPDATTPRGPSAALRPLGSHWSWD
ncbi:hypothetical protein Ae406Ps2_5070 [Pseudonocardia sp. Ae406_Ps2]|nr:hypothetical protein Ae331Ps2_0887c [Pseudonocardia sp. Ae331_Ps2]OLM05070.1 hypothetical protein Ae406Ps2_5070 [Pseudonocardia sp. Ae406_Ps2]OLM10117.1 hypothetical protein Ae505Ps2_0239c [Pseudonocardia sp. Ae505_Ps2]